MSSSRAIIGATLLLLVTTACAPRERTMASRFVTQGQPTIDLGGVETPVFGRPLTKAEAAKMPAPEPLRSVGERRSSNLSTLEASTPALQRALLALSLQPSTQRYLDVAAAYRQAGVRDKAFDYLSEGVRRDPADAGLHDALARAWRDWGFPERGLTAAHRAVYYAPQSAEARNTLGTVLWSLGQRTEARQAFQQAADLNPLAWYAWRNLCEAAMSEGRTKDATTLCRRAAALRKAAAETSR